ncbi:MAG: hypothetical protein K8F91_20975, partial [Candidatus Obscuribacterales bacterium]|nr:hypothetical protein [Candidatus Obscuribacterales bacterium]
MPRRHLLTVLLAQIVLLAGCVATDTAKPEGNSSKSTREVESVVHDLLKQAEVLNGAKQFRQAKALMEKAASYDPSRYSADVHACQADALRGLKDNLSAIKEDEKSLEFEPNDSYVLYRVVKGYEDLAYYDDGIQFLSRYMDRCQSASQKSRAQRDLDYLKTRKSYVLLKEAFDLIQGDKYRQAIEVLKRAESLKVDENSQNIQAKLAYAYERIGESRKAIAAGEKALKTGDDRHTVYIMALACYDEGNFDEAISWLNRYISSIEDPDSIKNAKEFIQELNDDKKKLTVVDSNLPDYFDQLKKAGNLQPWSKSSLPIKVYLPETSSSKGYKSSFRRYVLSTLDAWCLASGKKLDYRLVDDKASSDLEIEWTTEPLSIVENERTRKVAGLTTYPSMTASSRLGRTKIQVMTVSYQQ